MTTTEHFLSQAAYDGLKAELDGLVANRPVIAAEINARREEGDLRENGGYHAAREEQGKQEGRIRYLEHLLRHAVVGQPAAEAGVVGPGTVVTIRYDDDEHPETFLLGSREAAGSHDIEVYSPQSPLGAAVLGAKVGETRAYVTPRGATLQVHVLGAEPHEG